MQDILAKRILNAELSRIMREECRRGKALRKQASSIVRTWLHLDSSRKQMNWKTKDKLEKIFLARTVPSEHIMQTDQAEFEKRL